MGDEPAPQATTALQETPGPQQTIPSQETIVVSACLLGVLCNHEGKGRLTPKVAALAGGARLVPVCPEVAGGLPTPRPSAEVDHDRNVSTADGGDLTEFYRRGAQHAVAVALAAGARRAVLKARSPSCGCHQIYDGSHRRRLVAGEGLTAEALRSAGLEVISEEDL